MREVLETDRAMRSARGLAGALPLVPHLPAVLANILGVADDVTGSILSSPHVRKGFLEGFRARDMTFPLMLFPIKAEEVFAAAHDDASSSSVDLAGLTVK